MTDYSDMSPAELADALESRVAAIRAQVRPDGNGAAPPDIDAVAAARQTLAQAEAGARRTVATPPIRRVASPPAPFVQLDNIAAVVVTMLRDTISHPTFVETLIAKLKPHLAELAAAPVEPPAAVRPPWDALGVSREVYAKLKAQGALKD